MKTPPDEAYRKRIESAERTSLRLNRRHTVLGAVKALLILGGIISMYRVAAVQSRGAMIFLAVFLLLFIGTAVIHEAVLRHRRREEIFEAMNRNELQALNRVFLNVDDGSDFIDPDHNFSGDLDIFGSRSLFQYLNRTSTAMGRETLASWLGRKIPPPGGDIRAGQQAVAELAEKLDFRQKIRFHGWDLHDSSRGIAELTALFAETCSVYGKKRLIALIYGLPLLTSAAALGAFFGLSVLIPLGMLSLHLLVVMLTERISSRVYRQASKKHAGLRLYARMIDEIEKASFQTVRLRGLRQGLESAGRPASFHLRKLSSLLGLFEMRTSNFIHLIINTAFFWDLHCVLRIEAWKMRVAKVIPRWLHVIGECEALCSLANNMFNHPDWNFPSIVEDGFVFEAAALGTPLLPESERIDNDFRMNGRGRIAVITGPNMAGKSTFLKAVGVNLILAQTGSPVCAADMRVTPMRLYTSMKVVDSLDKGLSLFYAELLRLKNLLDPIAQGHKVFFLIDEMLKGTNASDRQKGSIALLHQLVKRRANGLVATHDLLLTDLEAEYPEKVANYHFDGRVKGDRLIFDYRLHPGKCESFNALLLMRRIGIDV